MNGQLASHKNPLRGGQIAGVAVSAGLHLALVITVILAHRFGGKSQMAAPKREPLKARLIKAGSPDGTEPDPSKVRAGTPWGKRKKGPVIHPYGPKPRPVKPNAHPVPPESGQRPGYVTNRFAPKAEKKNDETPPGEDKDKADKALSQQSDMDRLAGKELDPANVRHGGYGTARDGRTDVRARGAYGTSAKGVDDPCATGFRTARASYQAQITRKVSAFKRPPFISASLAENLVTRVRVTFNAAGKIVSVATVSSSGNSRFDQAAESFIRNLGAFPPPPRCVMFDVKIGRFVKTRSFRVNMKGR